MILVVGFLALFVTNVGLAASLSQREASVLSVVNEVRAGYALRPLVVDRRLTRVARSHSSTLLRKNVFTHGAMEARLRRAGVRAPRVGENLAWGVGRRASAAAVVRSWLTSPGHRANLLRPGYRRIGIGAVTGSFAGYRGATVVTVNFAGR